MEPSTDDSWAIAWSNELLVIASASDRRDGKRTVSLVGWHRQGHLALTLRVFVRDFVRAPGRWRNGSASDF